MPKNILIDLNIILDVLLERKGYKAALSLFELGESKAVRLCTSSHIVTTFVYILEGAKVPRSQIELHLVWLLNSFSIVPVDKGMFKFAISSQITDYEDAVLEQTALLCKASVIVTRNIKDFKNSVVKAVLPEDYIVKDE